MHLVGWKEHLHRHAIQPIQQFAYTKGKNSTDSAFIIDAMDLLYASCWATDCRYAACFSAHDFESHPPRWVAST